MVVTERSHSVMIQNGLPFLETYLDSRRPSLSSASSFSSKSSWERSPQSPSACRNKHSRTSSAEKLNDRVWGDDQLAQWNPLA